MSWTLTINCKLDNLVATNYILTYGDIICAYIDATRLIAFFVRDLLLKVFRI